MRMKEMPTIVTNSDLLSETYIPPNIPTSELQIKELPDFIAPAQKKKKLY